MPSANESTARLRLVIDMGDGVRLIDVLERLERQSKETDQAIDRLSGEINGLARSFDKAGDEARQTEDQVDKLNKSGRRLGITFGDIRNILIAVGGIQLFKAATKSSVSFEAQIDRVGALVRGTTEDMEALEGITRQLGATTQFTATEAAEGAEALSLAGLEIQEIIKSLPDTLNLSAIEDLEVGRAAEILGTTLNQFQEDADQASRIADTLAAASTEAAVSVTELGEALKLTGGSAVIAGLDVEATTALLGKLADAGLKGSLGGTALNRFILELVTPKAELEELVGPIDLASQGFDEVFQRVASTLTEEQAFEIFDARAARAFAFLKPAKDDVKALEEQIRSLGGVSEEMARQVTDNTGGAFKEFFSSVEASFITFGEAGYLEGITALLDEMSDTIRDTPFQEFAADAGSAFGDAAFAAAGFLAILRDIEESLPDFDDGEGNQRSIPRRFLSGGLPSVFFPESNPLDIERAYGRLQQRGRDEAALRDAEARFDEQEAALNRDIAQAFASGDPERQQEAFDIESRRGFSVASGETVSSLEDIAAALGIATAAQDDLNEAQSEGAQVLDEYNKQLDVEIDRAERLAAAARRGPEDLEQVEREIELETALEKLRAKAAKDGKDFDEGAARRRLERLSALDQEREANERLFEVEEKRRQAQLDKIAQGIETQVDIFGDRVDRADFDTIDEGRRRQILNEFRRELREIETNFDAAGAVLDEDNIEDLRQVLDDAERDLLEAFRQGGEEAAERIESGVARLSGTLLNDIFFNQGKGLDRIFENVKIEGVNEALINPISDFLAGRTDDLFGSIDEGLSEFTSKFSKIGDRLDELIGTDFLGGAGGAFAGAGAGFAGHGAGSGLADFLNGSAGETGGKVGGAVGGGIGFAVGGPVGAFIGSAIGGFFGDVFGGLFGSKKTASGTLDLDSGSFDGKDSRKDVRNERRDAILQGASDALDILGELLDAELRNFTGLQVDAGKKRIDTSIIDTRTGQAIAVGGSVGAEDAVGALDQLISRALDVAFEGGDETLTNIAQALSGAGVPTEKLIDTLSEVSDALSLIEEPQSQFIEGLETIVNAFEGAIEVSGRYAAATRDLAEAQLDAIEKFADQFDEDIETQRRRIEDPLAQDAIELAENQQQRLEEASALNEALENAVNQLQGAGSQQSTAFDGFRSFNVGGVSPSQQFDPDFYLDRYPDVARAAQGLTQDDLRYLADLGFGGTPNDFAQFHFQQSGRSEGRLPFDPVETSTPAANDNLTTGTDLAADAQERLNEVIALNTLEWQNFIEAAASTPEAFRAASEAIERLRDESSDLPVDFAALDQTLESVKSSLAEGLDTTIADREVELNRPLQIRIREVFEQQAALIEAANVVSVDEDDLKARIEGIFDLTVLELDKLIEAAGDAPEALHAAIEALQAFSAEAEERGADPDLINQQIGEAQDALRLANTEVEGDRLLRLVSTPAAEFRALLDRLAAFTERAQVAGSDPSLTQRANDLEIDRFLDSLTDEEIRSIGDVYGQISDSLGEGALVFRQLDEAFGRFIENREEELGRIEQQARRAGQLSDNFGDYGRELDRRFGGRLPQQDVDLLLGELSTLLSTAEDSGASVDDRLDAAQEGRSVAEELIDAAVEAYGGTARTADIVAFVQDAVDRFEGVTGEVETERETLLSALDREYDVLIDIRDSIQSNSLGGEVADVISAALDSGQITSEPFVGLLEQIVTLSRASQIDRGDLTDAIKDVAINAFSGDVSVSNVVTIDDRAMTTLLVEIRNALNEIENNQRLGGTESRIGLAA